MKRNLLLIITMTLAVFCLYACDSGDSVDGGENDGDEAEDGDEAADGDENVEDGDSPSGDCNADGMETCSAECVNTNTNKLHCGGCNNECLDNSTCVEGVCSCSGDLAYCNGECVNLLTDVANCGTCLFACQAEQLCYGGKCLGKFDEICDNVDNDLNGMTDEDAAGNPLARDCDNLCGTGTESCEAGEWVNCSAPAPEAEECNGEDDNCDGLTDEGVTTTYYEDFDDDGYGDPDLAWATEACSMPPAGSSQNGADYVLDNTDCDDENPNVYPGHAEDCDEIDNNCDNDIDEGCSCAPLNSTKPCGSDKGICVKGEKTCTDDGWSACGGDDYVTPEDAETCNLKDDDCDGKTDEELADDLYEVNDSCESARPLPEVWEDDPAIEVTDLSLYHGSLDTADSDWFSLTALELIHPECILSLLDEQCDFVFSAKLTPPSDEVADDYVLCVYSASSCGDDMTSFCTDDENFDTWSAEDHAYQMFLSWDGSCLSDDSWDFFVEVKSADGSPNSCVPYELEFQMDWGGVISPSCD